MEADLQKLMFEQMKKSMLFKYLTKEARERLNRIKLVRPELAERVELAIVQAIQGGQLKNQIDDNQLKDILNEVMSGKKEFKIIKK